MSKKIEKKILELSDNHISNELVEELLSQVLTRRDKKVRIVSNLKC